VPASVSILIPCFNAERFLGETLESALRQTLAAEEIIVVDDHSTDGSRAIVTRHGLAVTLLENPGRGASAARNRATQGARGEFLQYLDADDLLAPEALATRVEALQQTGADVAVSDWQRLEPEGGAWRPGKIESGRLPDGPDPADLAIFRGFWAPPAAILYRRALCERIGGWRENLPVIQDARFLLDAARIGGKFVHVPGVGARYRQHVRGSLSSADPARFWRDVLQNAREVEQLWREAGRLDAGRRDALAGAYGHSARVGFVHDRSLFASACVELHRFPDRPPSRFLRVALLLSRAAGYRVARGLLAPFCR
jgi:glycosyltransferase involved in cell wall biosynthesis